MTSQTGSLRPRTGFAAVLPRAGLSARAAPGSERARALGELLCLAALIVAAGLNGLPVRVRGLSIYPEYIALGVVLVWAIVSAVIERRRWQVPPAAFALGAWLVAELLATLLHAPTLHHSLVLWLKLPMMVATYVLVANLARNRLGQAVVAQGAVAAGIGLFAVLCYVNWKVTGSHVGMQQPARNFGTSWLPAVTLREPDIVGSYLVAASLLLMPLAAQWTRFGARFRFPVVAAGGLTVLGTLVSGSRTAWIALAAGIGLASILATARWCVSRGRAGRVEYAPTRIVRVMNIVIGHARRTSADRPDGEHGEGGDPGGETGGLGKRRNVAFRRSVPSLRLFPFIVSSAVLVGAIVGIAAFHGDGMQVVPAFNPNQDGDLLQRVASFGNLARDHNVVVRVEVAENALLHWQTHELTGWGTGAYGEVYRYPPPDTVHAGWISNLPIHLLYDSGLIGLLAFAAAIVIAARRGIAAWRRSWDVTSRAMVAGILLALFGLLLAFQATDATWFAYPWVYLGLLEAAVLSTPARRSESIA